MVVGSDKAMAGGLLTPTPLPPPPVTETPYRTGRTLGLSRQKKGRRQAQAAATPGGSHGTVASESSPHCAAGSSAGVEDAGRPSSDPLGLGTRVYARLAEVVAGTIHVSFAGVLSIFD